ncbi:tetratricopeptide repeat protein [Malonomonas rubra]|uniref:tetratricopeptide repeat protein n=1 Tax=Malonomonas rubra TaxID=57040 RepID=UPI0026F153A7|nr:tetratricopeptide repeat protein [Malonomonas rubra]
MTTKRLFPLLAASLLLASCALLPPSPSQNRAVLSLLDQANNQITAGQLDQAGASLERAMRIEPLNPALWQELAQVRIAQGRYQQAENMAAKSNALAEGNRSMREKNWRLIAEARRNQGDDKGAQAALDRASGK